MKQLSFKFMEENTEQKNINENKSLIDEELIACYGDCDNCNCDVMLNIVNAGLDIKIK